MSRDELETRLVDHIARATGREVAVTAMAPLLGGACQDLFRVELVVDGVSRVTVLRSDAASSLPTSLARRDEYRVVRAAVDAGVPTPRVYWPAEHLVRDGASSYFMDWVDGVTIARKLLSAPALSSARERLPDQLAAALGRIHAITPRTAPTLGTLGSAAATGAAEACLAQHRQALDSLSEPRPVLELAVRWLDANRPAPCPPTLCHGDFRVGNFAVNQDGLVALLDWEFAHWGDPMDDLGWLCVRDWRFGHEARAAGGLCDRATFYAAYERATGAIVDPTRVHYWELMGNLRWAIGAIYQGERYVGGPSKDLELIAIGHRVRQLEYEILRLVEHSN